MQGESLVAQALCCAPTHSLAAYHAHSDVRQVPDTQEVHLSRDVNDISLILEILESVKDGEAATDLEAAVR